MAMLKSIMIPEKSQEHVERVPNNFLKKYITYAR
jgi:DNA replicative helicase MCM subunit Mcm2 (Cdc46/Mcm family)